MCVHLTRILNKAAWLVTLKNNGGIPRLCYIQSNFTVNSPFLYPKSTDTDQTTQDTSTAQQLKQQEQTARATRVHTTITQQQDCERRLSSLVKQSTIHTTDHIIYFQLPAEPEPEEVEEEQKEGEEGETDAATEVRFINVT